MQPAIWIAVAQAGLYGLAPWAAAVALALNLLAAVAAFAVGAAGRGCARRGSTPLASPVRGAVAFVSVHVPPPKDASAAAATLAALSRVAYPAFEVLVADPGGALSADPALSGYRGRALFLRVPAAASAAEALNALLAEMDWRARYVAVADPDYAVEPQFLRLAVDHLERDPALAFVQFPKSLERAGPLGAAADLESRDALASARPTRATALRMGAITVVAVEALHAVGGWREGDGAAAAELGGRLWRADLSGAFIDAPVASPLKPLDWAAIREARASAVQAVARLAWSQLRALAPAGWRNGALALATQFAAAPSFWLLPAATLAAWCVGVWLRRPPSLGASAAETIAAGTILLTAALAGLRLAWIGLARRRGLRGIAAALAIRLALVWTASVAWLDRPSPRARAGWSVRIGELNLAPALIGLAVIATAAAQAHALSALAGLLLAATCPAAAWALGALSRKSWAKPA